jgi:hypothetical protein
MMRMFTRIRKSSRPRYVLYSLLLAGLIVLLVHEFFPTPVQASAEYMVLTVNNYEVGSSYRNVQWHSPIGQITNPCSYADHLTAMIDWNDGTGEHKPDTNAQTKLFQNTTPVIQNGVYLFWDDGHVPARVGTQTVTTKLSLHCLGDPPGDNEYVAQNAINVFPRIPVNQVAFTKNDLPIENIKGHDVVDVTITLNAPAPASGTWVKLETNPPGAINSLPPYFRISLQQTQETIRGLEVRKPASAVTIFVTASTVGRPQQSQTLTILP